MSAVISHGVCVSPNKHRTSLVVRFFLYHERSDFVICGVPMFSYVGSTFRISTPEQGTPTKLSSHILDAIKYIGLYVVLHKRKKPTSLKGFWPPEVISSKFALPAFYIGY